MNFATHNKITEMEKEIAELKAKVADLDDRINRLLDRDKGRKRESYGN